MQTGKPLRIVGGTSIVNSIAFYIGSEPDTFEIRNPRVTPWVGAERIRTEGIALVCPEADPYCMAVIDRYIEAFHAVAVEHTSVSRVFLGTVDEPDRFEIAIVTPSR
jgi:hypothetical protein